jgi:hypothetical protein
MSGILLNGQGAEKGSGPASPDIRHLRLMEIHQLSDPGSLSLKQLA